MWCIVNLPNGTQQAVEWDPKAIGQECLEKVCKALGIICEMEYFGLEHWTPNQKESRTRQWINLRNRLSCDSNSSSGIQLMLALRVKFWVPVHFILQESVRNLFYMQAKVDLLEGRLNARDWKNAAKLAALLCQADGIRFNEFVLKATCPIRMRKEYELLKQQEQQQLIQQQHQLHSQHLHMQHKERKEKEHVLSFKKRRLSKQKSVEHIEPPPIASGTAYVSTSAFAPSVSISAQTISEASMLGSSNKTTPTSSEYSTSNANNLKNCPVPLSVVTATLLNESSLSSPSNAIQNSTAALEGQLSSSPLRVYQEYILRPTSEYDSSSELPDDFLHEIAIEHGKLAKLKMTPKSAKYWLLQEIQDLNGYGEEIFSGVTTNEHAPRCDVAVGAHGITVCRGSSGDEHHRIPFSAIATAKSFRRTFKLEYVDDHNDRKDLEIKLPKHAIAAGLYRSITERHAFYVCDKVRGVVTNQFTRDLKGTIASMFNEDTELGKRYVFDIQHTCREVHDQARRILHERGIEISPHTFDGTGIGAESDNIANYLPISSTLLSCNSDVNHDINGLGDKVLNEASVVANTGAICRNGFLGANCSMAGKLDLAIREKEAREAAIERCVDTRISEAMTCKICMDRAINTMFNPCCHVIACAPCAARCNNCPNCRVKITSVVKIYLPPELRTSQSDSSELNCESKCSMSDSCDFVDGNALITSAVTAASSSGGNATAPKISSAA